MNTEWFHQHESLLRKILELQHRIWARLNDTDIPPSKSWFTPAEVAKVIQRKQGTVRGWCRNRRLDARKRPQGRGDKLEWEISEMELRRYRDHGLLPLRPEPKPDFDQTYSQPTEEDF